MNAGIQGLAADIFKVALVRLDAALARGGTGSRLVLQVHDEVLVEVADGRARTQVGELTHTMLMGAARAARAARGEPRLRPHLGRRQGLTRFRLRRPPVSTVEHVIADAPRIGRRRHRTTGGQLRRWPPSAAGRCTVAAHGASQRPRRRACGHRHGPAGPHDWPDSGDRRLDGGSPSSAAAPRRAGSTRVPAGTGHAAVAHASPRTASSSTPRTTRAPSTSCARRPASGSRAVR